MSRPPKSTALLSQPSRKMRPQELQDSNQSAIAAAALIPPRRRDHRRIALLAVDSASRTDALEQAETAANERSVALVTTGAAVVSMRVQMLGPSPWHVIVTIEYTDA